MFWFEGLSGAVGIDGAGRLLYLFTAVWSAAMHSVKVLGVDDSNEGQAWQLLEVVYSAGW
jgi:hypothetical protein